MDRNLERVWSVALGDVEEEEEEDETICAFCLITSAGVRIAHETSSASEDEVAWMMATGRTPLGECEVVLREVKRDFVRS